MLIILKESFELKNSKNEVLFTIAAGSQLTTIRRTYISPGSAVLSLRGGNVLVEDVAQDNVFIYLHENFIAIPTSMVEIPISTNNGWSPNF